MKYYIAYAYKLVTPIAISENLKAMEIYLDQFNLNREVYISHKNIPSELVDFVYLYELRYLTQNLILTNIEIEYYKEILNKLYDDMKNTISGLIIYTNMGLISEKEKSEIKQLSRSMYSKMKNFDDFVDSIDKAYLFGHIIQNPLTMQNILKEHMLMKERYDRLKMLED